jgi:Domain of unknown function (DUF1840)
MFKFKSRAAGDLIMLEPNGRQILTLIGKYHGPEDTKGILLPEHMLQAIADLQAAIERDEADKARRIQEAQDAGEPAPRFEGITLRQRAVPFIEMMRRSHQAEREIVWGV